MNLIGPLLKKNANLVEVDFEWFPALTIHCHFPVFIEILIEHQHGLSIGPQNKMQVILYSFLYKKQKRPLGIGCLVRYSYRLGKYAAHSKWLSSTTSRGKADHPE